MPIIVRLDVEKACNKMPLNELAKAIGVALCQIYLYSKPVKARAIRFPALGAICEVLNCQPGDIWSIYKIKKCLRRASLTGSSGADTPPQRLFWGVRRHHDTTFQYHIDAKLSQ